jgi:hypothetical protein
VGYVFPTQAPGTVPLHRYYKGDHFYTTNLAELGHGRDGWRYEGVAAYIIDPKQSDAGLTRSVAALFPNENDRTFRFSGRFRGESTTRKIDIMLASEPLNCARRLPGTWGGAGWRPLALS